MFQSNISKTTFRLSRQEAFDVEIFPNPGHGSYDLTIKGNSLSGLITMYNFMGTVIAKQPFNGSTQHLDISGNAKGIYYVKVESEGQIKMLKIIYE
jgi:hypothetical protein